ncbi:hypothetical protein O6H91_21G049700 [Diphasiastrum complanatum]|uniref:Uncharacterized protein n=1 Tax=Diphasiastrum complanatum TaxID=34168 RepID=A0ACC2AKB0_DIPCM|nr:hypothetical protein O6H91_21G049700 [Diphasiastrum complanatum]
MPFPGQIYTFLVLPPLLLLPSLLLLLRAVQCELGSQYFVTTELRPLKLHHLSTIAPFHSLIPFRSRFSIEILGKVVYDRSKI